MLNFEFYNPTRIVFGQNKVAELARLVPQDARVLVLYGGGSARSTGTLAEVLAALGERTVFEFGGIEPNPSYETLSRAVDLARAERIDYLLAVGGGSVLDPTKTYTLPLRQIANGLVDAYVHTMEQYLTYPVNAPAQDRFAEGLLQTLIELAPRAMQEGEPDYDNRANLMWTATLALNGLIGAGVPQDWATHMIGHELTALYGIDHARTLAIVLPQVMQARREAKREKLLQYAARVWHITEGSDDERIDAAIARTAQFFESVGIPTRLSAYELGSDAVDAVVKALTEHGMVKLGEQRAITPEISRAILEAAL